MTPLDRRVISSTHRDLHYLSDRMRESQEATPSYTLDICDYYRMTGQLDSHPECRRGMPEPETTTTEEPVRIGFCSR
ncbi:hypothetical protein ANCDUO_16554 [Ancylostoma duodenale]|uniref:Uncharacterized protein n=1 Tax=Ancylostoma duodenale TaxID=51022 RepID=A0A0C2G8I4_9BILA|nr:hypothetical protein ANCDUO_16554 [Ancylostoma duodenale]